MPWHNANTHTHTHSHITPLTVLHMCLKQWQQQIRFSIWIVKQKKNASCFATACILHSYYVCTYDVRLPVSDACSYLIRISAHHEDLVTIIIMIIIFLIHMSRMRRYIHNSGEHMAWAPSHTSIMSNALQHVLLGPIEWLHFTASSPGFCHSCFDFLVKYIMNMNETLL